MSDICAKNLGHGHAFNRPFGSTYKCQWCGALQSDIEEKAEYKSLLRENKALKEQNALLTVQVQEIAASVRKEFSTLITLAAQMARREGMPNTEQVTFSTGVPKKTWRSILKMETRASDKCADWAYGVREVANRLSTALSALPQQVKSDARDAEYWRFYRDYAMAWIDGMPLHEWIERNSLKLGGRDEAIRAAISAQD